MMFVSSKSTFSANGEEDRLLDHFANTWNLNPLFIPTSIFEFLFSEDSGLESCG